MCSWLKNRSVQPEPESSVQAIRRVSDSLNEFEASFYIKNCLFVRILFTSYTHGMTSLESLSKDVIPSVLEVNCIRNNKQFFT